MPPSSYVTATDPLSSFSFDAMISGWSSKFLVKVFHPLTAIASLLKSTRANDFSYAEFTTITIS
jgi:hypothetical protein